MEYDRPIYLQDVSYAPFHAAFSYARFLQNFKYIKTKDPDVEAHSVLKNDAVNQIYQSISRFKSPFYADQRIKVYYVDDPMLNSLISAIKAEWC